MKQDYLVSVIIPCYNVSLYVEQAIQSILDQTYKNLEIFIIDDASTDDTLFKIKKFNDGRIRIAEFKENTQKVGAVNDILMKVNGDFICFQDSDDWSEPRRIMEQVEQFTLQPDLGVCFTNYRFFDNAFSLPGKISLTNEQLRNEFLEFGNTIENNSFPTVCGTMMISKTALKATGGYHPYFKGRVAEDIHWVYRILKEFNGVTLDRIMYNYRIREGSFTDIIYSGKNAKYIYCCQLLSKIIYRDVHENIDVLDPTNKEMLSMLELEACEEKLLEATKILNETRNIYESSFNFKLGKFILKPWRFFNSIKKETIR